MPTTKQSDMADTLEANRRQAVRTLALVAAAGLNVASAQPASRKQAKTMTIRIIAGQDRAVAELEDNPTSRDFLTLLPMTVELEDFAGKEKIKRLSTSGSPSKQPASVWDIAYYVPWANIAIFYKPYDPSPDLVKMGRVVSGHDIFTKAGSFTARIELAN